VRVETHGVSATLAITATGSRFTSVAFISRGPEKQACGVTHDGELQCWVLPRFEEASSPPAIPQPEHAPVPIDPGQQYLRVHGHGFEGAFEERAPLCGLTQSGMVRCRNDATGAMEPLPSPVSFTAIAVATTLEGSICGLDAEQRVWCRGDNTFGQLGDGTTNSRVTFAPVSGGLRAVALFGLHDQVCALDTAGMAWCWGRSDGLTPDASNTPITVPTRTGGERAYRALAGVYWGVCGLPVGGTSLYCWGGSAMEGMPDPASGGTAVAGSSAVAEMSGMDNDAIFRTANGTLLAAGDHAHSPPLFAFVPVPQPLPHWPAAVTTILSRDSGKYWCVAHVTGSTLCSAMLRRVQGVPLPR
jgi:hypothetical protein